MIDDSERREKARKCNRCGKDIPCSDLFTLDVTTGLRMFWFLEEIYLCDDCMKSFRKWFNDPEAKEESR